MVNKAMLHPQEIETYYIIPTVRKYFALFLVDQGLKQKDVAAMLGVHTAAISQYRSKKRGMQVTFPPEIINEMKKSALKIKDHFSYFQEMQRLLHLIRKTKVLCQIHHQFSPIPQGCDPHKIGCITKKIEQKECI
ncbi:hypothetical protein HYV86_07195 [Candidatus Woesearchaeota archaeon]|nr:hypothetical protein [Candidatus Woesearchaeota archaeon]